MVTVYVLAFTVAGCGPVPPELPGQEAEHTDAESPTGSVSPPKTHCGGPNGLIRRCDDEES